MKKTAFKEFFVGDGLTARHFPGSVWMTVDVAFSVANIFAPDRKENISKKIKALFDNVILIKLYI
jgi:hypothetical protein